jgi:3-hydroxyisobutyrate dehydrogenase
VREVGFGSGGLVENVRRGQIVVDMTTATVRVARELAAALEARGAQFADAPVAKGVPSAEDGTLSIMVGASEDLFRRLEPLLATMGTEIARCGGIGTGQVVKLMNNMLVFQTVSALAEALAIGTRAGVDGKRLFEVLSHGSADSFALRRHGSWMAKGEYPDDQFPTTYSLKDLRYALELAADTGVDAKGAKLVESRLAEAIERGYGRFYSPVIYKLFEEG